ncbi:MAG: hypothetical protein COV45_08915 [Deltaproteobacteria bacterium CG11_big_fil_rev_8_21_14_0_20_47_16]|nr:MAG: hypothetical protein COV45_08915 [Deltaproteobacteria bacterium CG11_big_fil_rev_8_21_14_0_20_47_16]
MFHSGLTKPERELRTLLRFWLVAFFLVGLVFATFPDDVSAFLNTVGQYLRWPGPELPPMQGHLWHVLAISLMGILVVICSRAIKELGHSLLLVRLLMMAKSISGVGYIIALGGTTCFAYLAGAVIDLGIAGLTYFYYRQVVALKGSQ